MKKVCLVVSLIIILSVAFSGSVFAFMTIDPLQAYTMTTTDPNVYIVDVRTEAEWRWVGHPGPNKLGEGASLNGKVVNISYKIDRKGAFVTNPSFVSDIAEIFGRNSNVVLIMMCRSGGRGASAAAALEAEGYNVMNMATGFEGGGDSRGYLTVSGWRNAGLPYVITSAGGYAD